MQSWKCIACGKKFEVGAWTCQDGQTNHVVETKEYLLADAPSDPGHAAPGSHSVDSLRDGRTRICNIPPDKAVMFNGERILIPGGNVEFIRGRFSTTDPEVQYYLEKTRGKAFCSEERWKEVWLSRDQQISLREADLRAREARLEVQTNELLTQTKQRVSA